MLRYDIPGLGVLELEHIVLDLNGTLAEDGELIDGVADLVSHLAEDARVVVVTADTHGRAPAIRDALGCEVSVLDAGREAEQKRALVDRLGAYSVAAVGNGANDAAMLEAARLGVCVVGAECAAAAAVRAADLIAPDILSALRTLAMPARLIATLRR